VAGALGGEIGVAADHQSLAGSVVMLAMSRWSRELQGAGLRQRPDRRRAQLLRGRYNEVFPPEFLEKRARGECASEATYDDSIRNRRRSPHTGFALSGQNGQP
jgi:hypothetical protein